MSSLKRREEKPFLLCDFYNRGSHLIFYEDGDSKYRAFTSFIECGVKNKDVIFYAHPRGCNSIFNQSGGFVPWKNVKVHTVECFGGGLKDEDVLMLHETISSLGDRMEGHRGIRVLFDFGRTLNRYNLGRIKRLEEWSHKDRGFLISTLSAFDSRNMFLDAARDLMKMHENITFFCGPNSKIFYPDMKGDRQVLSNFENVASKQEARGWIKKSLDVLVLSMLWQKPMCGFEVLKTIVRNFGVLLSQGTIYPLLKSLRDQGYVKVIKESRRGMKVYALTEKGEKLVKIKVKNYVNVQRALIGFMERYGSLH